MLIVEDEAAATIATTTYNLACVTLQVSIGRNVRQRLGSLGSIPWKVVGKAGFVRFKDITGIPLLAKSKDFKATYLYSACPKQTIMLQIHSNTRVSSAVPVQSPGAGLVLDLVTGKHS